MQGAVWTELLGRIPERQWNQLVVMTTAHVEIAVQEFVRMEEEYVAIRGRLAGSSDTGRLFFVPYDRIAYLGIQKAITDPEIVEIYGSAPPARVATAQPGAPGEAEKTAPSEPEPEPESEPLPPSEGLRGMTNLTPTVMPNRTELLERIRSRSKAGGGQTPPKK
jgi:hypothetical protein